MPLNDQRPNKDNGKEGMKYRDACIVTVMAAVAIIVIANVIVNCIVTVSVMITHSFSVIVIGIVTFTAGVILSFQ